MTTTLERVRAAVIKAVPEIEEWRCQGCKRKYAQYVNGCVHCWRYELERDENIKLFPVRGVRQVDRDITLADVLVAMSDAEDGSWTCYVAPKYMLHFTFHEYGADWNLALPLHLQSEEVLTFLDKTLNHD